MKKLLKAFSYYLSALILGISISGYADADIRQILITNLGNPISWIVGTNSLLGSAATGTIYFIGTNSVDGADSNRLDISSASARDSIRSAWALLGGNENGSPGQFLIAAGRVANAKVQISIFDSAQATGSPFSVQEGDAGATYSTKFSNGVNSGLSGATSTFTGIIPAGAVVKGVVCRVTTLITGATSFDIGDGTDVDRWGAAISPALNTTTSSISYTADPAGTWSAAARNIVLTANGSNFTGGTVRCSAIYSTMTGPTG